MNTGSEPRIRSLDREHAARSIRAALSAPYPHSAASLSGATQPLPSPALLAGLVDVLASWLFPGFFDNCIETSIEEKLVQLLEEQFAWGLHSLCPGKGSRECEACSRASRELASEFLRSLPETQKRLWLDLEAAFEGDPAAKSREEIVLCYPGFRAVVHYRLAHEMHRLRIPLLPRILAERAHAATGIDIHPAAVIGEGFFLDHGTGIVIGETCRIGDRVRIYQGVTLGAKKLPFDEQGRAIRDVARHPIVGDGVVIYAGATILGRVEIGSGSVIGGNVWLTQSVPPRSRITQATVRQKVFEEGAGI